MNWGVLSKRAGRMMSADSADASSLTLAEADKRSNVARCARYYMIRLQLS